MSLAREKLPNQNYVYLGDNLNFPYGTKTPETIRWIVRKNIERLIEEFNPKALVIACNTATVTALSEMRRLFSFPIIGIVPAVKPAAAFSSTKKIGVLATETTIKGEYLEQLINDYASKCTVCKVAAQGLVEFVETRFLEADEKEIREILDEPVNEMMKCGVDSLVLGCTHFIYLYDTLFKMMNERTEIIDSREGVVNQLIRVLEKNGLKENQPGSAEIYMTDSGCGDRYRDFSDFFGFSYKGVLNVS